MNNYYINDKQVNYSIFSYQLMKICKYLALEELYDNDKEVNEYSVGKLGKSIYFEYYNKMKNEGVILKYIGMSFKVVKGGK